MSASIRWAATALVVLVAGGFASQANADQPGHYFVNPHPPRLGIYFHMVYWPVRGYYVSSVAPGSRAHQLGLEPGDIITRVNGYPLTYHGEHQSLMGGSHHFSLTVRNCRHPHNIVTVYWPPSIGIWSSRPGGGYR